MEIGIELMNSINWKAYFQETKRVWKYDVHKLHLDCLRAINLIFTLLDSICLLEVKIRARFDSKINNVNSEQRKLIFKDKTQYYNVESW